MADWVVAGIVAVIIFTLLAVVAAGILAARFNLASDVECLVACLIAVVCWLFLLFPMAGEIGLDDATGKRVKTVDMRWEHSVEAATLFLPMSLAPLIAKISSDSRK
jgi:hypothetical protein